MWLLNAGVMLPTEEVYAAPCLLLPFRIASLSAHFPTDPELLPSHGLTLQALELLSDQHRRQGFLYGAEESVLGQSRLVFNVKVGVVWTLSCARKRT